MQTDTSAIWNEFRSGLYSFIRTKVKGTADAEDILQEVFIKVHKSLSSLNDEQKLQSWLFTITRNAINDHYRKKKPVFNDQVPEQADASVEKQDMMQCMRPFISRLPEKYRVAIEYCDIGSHTQQQLADKEGISLPGAKSRLQRGRALLRQLFESCCHIETDKYGNVVEHIPKGKCACA